MTLSIQEPPRRSRDYWQLNKPPITLKPPRRPVFLRRLLGILAAVFQRGQNEVERGGASVASLIDGIYLLQCILNSATGGIG